MSIAMIAAAAALAAGTVAGPAWSAGIDATPTGPVAGVATRTVPSDDDHDWEKCRRRNPPKWCYDESGGGVYLPPVVGGYEPGQSPYPVGGYVSSPPGELVAPLGGGYVSTPPGEAIPPVGGGYVSTPPGVAISPVG